MSKLLLKNCNLITMDENKPKIIYEFDVLIEDSKILKIAKNIKVSAKKVINCSNKFVLPGLINCHTHIAMSIFKESIDGLNLQDWLNKFIWPAEAKLNSSIVFQASLYGMYESINSGITTINDMYFWTEAIVKAAKISGINMLANDTLLDVDGNGKHGLKAIEENINNYAKYCKVIPIHAFYSCSREILSKTIRLAKNKKLPIHMHFCENAKEVKDIKRLYKITSPSEVIMKYCTNVDLILAHCVKLDKKTIRLLAKMNANVVHNPTSNLKLGCGLANVSSYIEAGINVCLGTDGFGSGSNGDLFKEIRLACMLQKGSNEKPEIMNAYEGLKLATVNGAKALKMNKGIIAIGKDADLIILDLHKTLQTQPINDPISDIVYNASTNNVETVIINGSIVKENFKLKNVNIQHLASQINKIKQEVLS